MKKLFITGTDTDSGKTLVSSLILKALNRERLLTIGFKPIGSGGQPNPDAEQLRQLSTIAVPAQAANPFCFTPAIAPHIAAAQAGVKIEPAALTTHLRQLSLHKPDLVLTEGAGGWLLPINDDEYLSDWVVSETMDVILVVGMKLGCLNHALLTAKAIAADGGRLIGWVANQCTQQPMDYLHDNLSYLKAHMPAPCLAYVPYHSDTQQAEFTEDERRALLTAIDCNPAVAE
ncbi:dethiobiotin synthase [Aliidiomarina soli]|uniref:ATP-dependent dethiobiotin synthetase BioD n=1 Tax=Aliidiomarina soli TaxID=1928574 RepID=A0A432WMK2_9GAMM|nr:dethiobiotin synthase [Aliidiomarina soli]RUO34988.1 dethiobiotin synthase [Aliidiomarina soli]